MFHKLIIDKVYRKWSVTLKTNLNNVPIGKSAFVSELYSNKDVKRRLRDLGLIKNTLIKPLYKSPLNDPTAYLVRGSVIAIRNDDAKKIIVDTKREENK